MDYGNALLFKTSAYQLAKLQWAQNFAVWVLSGTSRFSHITPILKNLHWLPESKRIEFKILLYTWKALHGQAPRYLQNLISEYVPHRNFRSSSNKQSMEEAQPLERKPSFFSAPSLWNAFPLRIRSADSQETFKNTRSTTHYTCCIYYYYYLCLK